MGFFSPTSASTRFKNSETVEQTDKEEKKEGRYTERERDRQTETETETDRPIKRDGA